MNALLQTLGYPPADRHGPVVYAWGTMHPHPDTRENRTIVKFQRSVKGTPLRGRLRTILSSQSGGFDLPSVMTAFFVSLILIGAGLVLAVGVMPWSQDNISKDALGPVRTAQQAAKSTTRAFLPKADLIAKKAIGPNDTVDVAVDAGGNCYVAVAKSDTGRIFYVTNTQAEAKELPPTGDTGCLSITAVKALADGVGGFDDRLAGASSFFHLDYPDAVFSASSATAETVSPVVAASSGTLTYSYLGTLPDGVSFDTTTGQFTGSVWGSGANAVSAGGSYGCSLSNKKVFCWGDNTAGKLGNGTTTGSSVPVPVSGLPADKAVTAVSSGSDSSCAIAGGEAYCWGLNSFGQLGNGTTTNSSVAVKVDQRGVLGKAAITSISVGQRSACASANGSAYCWGAGTDGLRGDGATSPAVAASPVLVTSTGVLANKTVTSVSVAYNHACAIASGKAYCWGLNSGGQLGDASTVTRAVPVASGTSGAMAGKTVTSLSAGGEGASASTCAVASGKAYCWGGNGSGQLGDNTLVPKSSPVAVNTAGVLSGLTVGTVSTSYFHSCVTAGTSAGPAHAYCWGQNTDGRLGNGSLTDSSVPVSAGLDAEPVIAIATGRNHSCAIASGGADCWGLNSSGQLGNGTTAQSSRPLGVKGLGSNAGFPADMQVTVTNGTDSDTAQVKLELR